MLLVVQIDEVTTKCKQMVGRGFGEPPGELTDISLTDRLILSREGHSYRNRLHIQR
jgi:hypothetical protein